MAIKIKIGSPTYNKPPAPDKQPSKTLYPTILKIGKEHQAWVSVPQPDKLHLIGDVLPEHFAKTGFDIQNYGPSITEALASGLAGKVLHTRMQGTVYRQVQVEISPGTSPAFFQLEYATKGSPAVHSLEIQLNPKNLGEEGIFNLLTILHSVTAPSWKVGAFLATARVKRLDIAVDLIGLSVPDLIITAADHGKSVHYYGADGVLETVYLHKPHKFDPDGKLPKKAMKHPLGDVLVMVYDKTREQISKGLAPPFGPAPVTRVEVTKQRFGSVQFQLPKLRTMNNPLAGLKVGLVRSAGPPDSWMWLQYIEARRGGGPARAAHVLRLSPGEASTFEEHYAAHPSDVIKVKTAWKLWHVGIRETGLLYLIEAAEQKSEAVPFPAEWLA